MEDWLLPLQQGQPDVAWDRFLSRHRRLIFATIRHYTQDYDDGMELFAHLCGKLREDDMRRLRLRAEDPNPRAQFSTWLVAVVRHAAVDWFRHRDGRHRLSRLAQTLPAVQRRIFELVFVDRRSHVEAYETLRTEQAPALGFREFLAELRATYRAVAGGRRGTSCASGRARRRMLRRTILTTRLSCQSGASASRPHSGASSRKIVSPPSCT